MATLISFNAHPDDESIGMGGTLAMAAAEGHRVVVVVATRGELGETPKRMLWPGEELADRRADETRSAARILGVHRLVLWDYRDSGMAASASNNDPRCFAQAEVDQAAARLAALVVEEQADVLTSMDEHGITGHPDHIQVHRVGARAAELSGVARLYEATMDREKLARMAALAAQAGLGGPPAGVDLERFGSPSAAITTTVDVRGYLDAKREAMAAHASQIAETSVFLSMPREIFTEMWGDEAFIRRGGPDAYGERSLFARIDSHVPADGAQARR